MSASGQRDATAPIDSLDLSSLRDGSRREIPWDHDLPLLDDTRRAKLVHAWTWRREAEHLAVGAFAKLSYEAAAHGAEPQTLALLTRAATDEVHHADICRRVVEKITGTRLPTTMRGASDPHTPLMSIPTAKTADDLLVRIVETCCMSETFTGAYFTDMLEVATHPFGRSVVLSLLEDEIDHGRVGWAYLAAAKRDGRAGFLAERLPSLLERNVAFVFDDARQTPEDDDAELDPLGHMGRTRAAEVYRHAIGMIVLPGFDALDIDTRAARTLAAERGWI